VNTREEVAALRAKNFPWVRAATTDYTDYGTELARQGVRPFSKSNQEGRNAGKEEAGKIFSFFPIFLIHILGCLDDPMPQPKRSRGSTQRNTDYFFLTS
jgi:hypothetical protein